MPGYTNTHQSNVLDEINIPNSKIKRGMMIKVRYQKQSGETKNGLYLVLDPNYKARMHVLDLDYISPQMLKTKLFKHTKYKQPLMETINGRQYSRLEFSANSRNIYQSVISNLVNDGFGPSYRTLIPTKITQPRLVSYEWFESGTRQGVTAEMYKEIKKTGRAPTGGITINGRYYSGGQILPKTF